jgi:hypothetical protein
LIGRFKGTMKQLVGRTFRLFVSSTFSDLKEERNALGRCVFPKLRALCESRGYKLQVVDLRWGVPGEATIDQQTVRICLEEIARCQGSGEVFSPRPNFIVLLGDRYGWKPPPSLIPASEFNALISHLTHAEAELVKKWYRLDENSVPSEYVLQPRHDPPFDNNEQWAPVERDLRESIRYAAELIGLPEEARSKYGASATELEIWNGVLDEVRVPDAPEHVYAFFRHIREPEAVETSLSDPRTEVAKFAKDLLDTEVFGTGSSLRWDRTAWAKLEQLKTALEHRIGNSNIWRYDAEWANGTLDLGAIGEKIVTEKRPLAGMDLSPGTLCGEVWLRLSRVIIRQMDALDEQTKDIVETERTIHKEFRKDLLRVFHGRKEAQNSIVNYLASGTPRPLIVYGVPGSGKSALMAKAIDFAAELYPDAVIERYIGVTPGSSEVAPLLVGLCKEISRLFDGEESTVPTDYVKLVNDFPERLKLAKIDKPIILFLDALDQLGDTDDGRRLVWLPRELPPNVRIVVSTLPEEEHQCLQELRVSAKTGDFVEITPMSADESETVFTAWLAQANPPRILTKDQRNEILRRCRKNGFPLYLKLVFEEARRWHSYDGVPADALADDVPGMIRGLFHRLSKPEHHGSVIVSRALVYLATARFGLADDEMLDLLWRDDESREDFKARNSYHKLPEDMNTMPAVIWSRLFFDLRPYLAERENFGIRLLVFYHRQFREAVFDVYRTSKHDLFAAHRGLARCFEAYGTGYDRTLSELIYHLSQAHEDIDLIRLMTGDFPRIKLSRFGSVAEISRDYATAIESCERMDKLEDGVRFAVNRLDLHSEAAALLHPGLALLLARQATLSGRLAEVRRAEMLLQECVHEPGNLALVLSDLAAGLAPGPDRVRLLRKSTAILMSAARNPRNHGISQAAVHIVSSDISGLEYSCDLATEVLSIPNLDERDRQLIIALKAIDLWRHGQLTASRKLLEGRLPLSLQDETLETASAVLECLGEAQAAGDLVLNAMAIKTPLKAESKFFEFIPWLRLKNAELFGSIFLAARVNKREWIRSVIAEFRGSWFTRITGMLAIETAIEPRKIMSARGWLWLARLSYIDSLEWEAVGFAIARDGLSPNVKLKYSNPSFIIGLLLGAEPTPKIIEAIHKIVHRKKKRKVGAEATDLVAIGNAAIRSANAELAHNCLMAVIHQQKKRQFLRDMGELLYGSDGLLVAIGMYATWIMIFGWHNLISLIVLGVVAICVFFGSIYIVTKRLDSKSVQKIPSAEAFITKYVTPLHIGYRFLERASKKRLDLLIRLLLADNVLAGASASSIELMNQLLNYCSTSGKRKECTRLANAVAVAALRAGHRSLAEHATKLALEDQLGLEFVDQCLLAGAWLGEDTSRACAIGGLGSNTHYWIEDAVSGASTQDQKRKLILKGVRLLSAGTEYEMGRVGLLKLLRLSGKQRLWPGNDVDAALKHLRISRFISIRWLGLLIGLAEGFFLLLAILAGSAALLVAIPLRALAWPPVFSFVRVLVYLRLRQSGFLARTKVPHPPS